MISYKHQIRAKFPFYSQEFLNNLFYHPYTKIEFLEDNLQITRQTAAKYLDKLASAGLLKKEKLSRSNYYINTPLISIFIEAGK